MSFFKATMMDRSVATRGGSICRNHKLVKMLRHKYKTIVSPPPFFFNKKSHAFMRIIEVKSKYI